MVSWSSELHSRLNSLLTTSRSKDLPIAKKTLAAELATL